MKKNRSLVGTLTLFISLSLLMIWLISVFAATYASLSQARHHLIDNLSHFSALRATLSNHRFEGAERDAQTLAYRYHRYHSTPTDTPLADTSESHYIPMDTNACIPQNIQDQDRSFIQLYGTSGQTYYLDSFLLDRRYGISLLPPREHTADYFSRRLTELKELLHTPVHDNMYWGKPKYHPNTGWSVSVAASCPHGALAGLSVKLSDLVSYGQPISGNDMSLWLDEQNHILPFSSMPEKKAKTLQTLLASVTLRDGWQDIPGYLVLRTQLKGPGWQQVILYPTGDVMSRALSIVAGQLPFALAALLVLAITLFGLLHRHLARPLREFISIINKTESAPLSARLPDNRQDELGNIAHAYNALLDSLSAQHDNLENTVVERTRELIVAKQQAEQANKRKSSHLTTISHELRTPLSGALGALELLQMTDMTDKQSRLSETARLCTLSLLDIINNLLDFTRIESGHISLHVEKTALLPLLDRAMHTIQGPGQSKGLSLRTFVGDSVPLHIDVDATRLRQILVNLLGNAVKFTEKGGISLSVKRRGKQLIFSVSDSGKGIAPADQQAVFTPFFQSQGHIQGTGLGLTIAANLAQMMGGWLELSSTPGIGTRISFLLPLSHIEDTVPLAGTVSAPHVLHRQLAAWGVHCEPSCAKNAFFADELRFLPGKLYELAAQSLSKSSLSEPEEIPVQPWRLRILLVDDAAVNRDIIGAMLTTLGQDVITATHAEEALALGQKQRFDLVLMDIRMPLMDGLACTRCWRQDARNQDSECMIMALSANTAPEEISRSKDAGIHHYLTKPVTLPQLVDAISIAAEHQIGRDISLQEQTAQHDCALLTPHTPALRRKLRLSLHALLSELEGNLNNQKETIALLHTLKGCLGQAGFGPLLCDVIDMENRVKHGLPLPKEEIAELRHSLDAALRAQRKAGKSAFNQEVMENERS